jgi:hypothetical protein
MLGINVAPPTVRETLTDAGVDPVLAENYVRAGEGRSAWQAVAPGLDSSGMGHDAAVPRDDGWLCCCAWPT